MNAAMHSWQPQRSEGRYSTGQDRSSAGWACFGSGTALQASTAKCSISQSELKMIGKAFEQKMLENMNHLLFLHPFMQEEDFVKTVFQGMLGNGHLLPSADSAQKSIEQESLKLSADPEEPLFEPLSPLWCRLNLRRAKAEGLSSHVIAGLMHTACPEPVYTRRDVADACRSLAQRMDFALPNDLVQDRLLDDSWLPSHSEAYRGCCRPAYRVIPSAWIPCMEAVLAISRQSEGSGRLLVTLDGPCASGKTVLARRLSEVFSASVVHTDDFVIPHARKTAERLSIPGGNCDSERLLEEVILPFRQGASVRFRRYSCSLDQLLPEETLPCRKILILEGSYSSLPVFREQTDIRLFLDTPLKIREKRLLERESPESLERFRALWIPLENAYFSAYGLPDSSSIVIRTEA